MINALHRLLQTFQRRALLLWPLYHSRPPPKQPSQKSNRASYPKVRVLSPGMTPTQQPGCKSTSFQQHLCLSGSQAFIHKAQGTHGRHSHERPNASPVVSEYWMNGTVSVCLNDQAVHLLAFFFYLHLKGMVAGCIESSTFIDTV